MFLNWFCEIIFCNVYLCFPHTKFSQVLCDHFLWQNGWNVVMVCLCTVFFPSFPTYQTGLCNRLQRLRLSLSQLIQHHTLPLCWTSNDQLTPWGALKFLHFSSRLALPWSAAGHAGRGDICLSEDKGQAGSLSVCQPLRLDPSRHCSTPSLLFWRERRDLICGIVCGSLVRKTEGAKANAL